MKNTIKVTIPFSFKGKEFKPASVIDLDTFVQNGQDLEFIFHQVATENKINNFSYEYEVLESSDKLFSDATGLAIDFLSDNKFDIAGFKIKLNEANALKTLQRIASKMLKINNLDESPEIKQALLAAYEAGKPL